MDSYYLQSAADYEAFWCSDGKSAHRVDVISSAPPVRADPDEDVLTTLRKNNPSAAFHQIRLSPGQYYPRMARPSSIRPGCSPGKNPDQSKRIRDARAAAEGQLHALREELEKIFMVVHPQKENFKAFGHEIRNILILACTEVEAHWRNILIDNGIKPEAKTTTNHYVNLAPLMKLGEYQVTFPYYPWLESINPFENWTPGGAPTKDLPWYSAYNAVKHDRETKFTEATLLNALKAVTACFVMLCAQHGWDFALQGEAAQHAFFQLTAAPKWEPSEIYIPFGELKPINHPALNLSIQPSRAGRRKR